MQLVNEILDAFINERAFSESKRKSLADKGSALPDGSFPIINKQDLKNAIKAHGRAKNKEKAKAHIRKRAKALGLTDLIPASWSGKKEKVNEDFGTGEASFEKFKQDFYNLLIQYKGKIIMEDIEEGVESILMELSDDFRDYSD